MKAIHLIVRRSAAQNLHTVEVPEPAMPLQAKPLVRMDGSIDYSDLT